MASAGAGRKAATHQQHQARTGQGVGGYRAGPAHVLVMLVASMPSPSASRPGTTHAGRSLLVVASVLVEWTARRPVARPWPGSGAEGAPSRTHGPGKVCGMGSGLGVVLVVGLDAITQRHQLTQAHAAASPLTPWSARPPHRPDQYQTHTGHRPRRVMTGHQGEPRRARFRKPPHPASATRPAPAGKAHGRTKQPGRWGPVRGQKAGRKRPASEGRKGENTSL